MNHAFIVGCPRSGTSILGELVACHLKVKYVFETRNIWQKGEVGSALEEVKNGLISHRMTDADYTQENAKLIHDFFKTQVNYTRPSNQPLNFMKWLLNHPQRNKIIIEKNPRNTLRIPYIHSVFPDAKFIHILRDGRDVTCSLLPGIGGEEWMHVRPFSWRELIKLPPVERCALTWREIVLTADEDWNELPSLSKLLIRYENLVSNTQDEVFRIFDFLGLSITSEIKDFIRKIQNKTKNSYHAKKQGRWYRANHSVRIGRWRENLTPDQQNEVHNLIGDTLRYFGYINNVVGT